MMIYLTKTISNPKKHLSEEQKYGTNPEPTQFSIVGLKLIHIAPK